MKTILLSKGSERELQELLNQMSEISDCIPVHSIAKTLNGTCLLFSGHSNSWWIRAINMVAITFNTRCFALLLPPYFLSCCLPNPLVIAPLCPLLLSLCVSCYYLSVPSIVASLFPLLFPSIVHYQGQQRVTHALPRRGSQCVFVYVYERG